MHWILFIVLGVGVAALDLWTKQAVFDLLKTEIKPVMTDVGPREMVVGQRRVTIIPGFFELEANVNYGAFSGWFQRHTSALTLLSLAALAVVGLFFWNHVRGPGPHRYWLTAALGLLWGGTLGNFYDRLVHGYVRDFIKWFFVTNGKEHVWPNFNIADSAICVGVGIIVVLIFTDSFKARKAHSAAGAPGAPAAPAGRR